MENYLQIGIYRKNNGFGKAVFRKCNAQYRIPTLLSRADVLHQLIAYSNDLNRRTADPEFLLEIACPKRNNRILEIGLKKKRVELSIFEDVEGLLTVKFKWIGQKTELRAALATLRVFLFMQPV